MYYHEKQLEKSNLAIKAGFACLSVLIVCLIGTSIYAIRSNKALEMENRVQNHHSNLLIEANKISEEIHSQQIMDSLTKIGDKVIQANQESLKSAVVEMKQYIEANKEK